MKYYIIKDLQGGNFCEWTWEEPINRKELDAIFRDFAQNDGMEIQENLTIPLIAEIWGVEIHRVNVPIIKCGQCGCPTYKHKCPICGKIHGVVPKLVNLVGLADFLTFT